MKAKIFYGPARSGKSATANIVQRIIGADSTLSFTAHNTTAERIRKAIERQISINTMLIIVDDVPPKFDYETFYSIFPNVRFVTNQKGLLKQEIYLPNIIMIFTTNYEPTRTDASFLRRFDLVEFPNPNYFIPPVEVK